MTTDNLINIIDVGDPSWDIIVKSFSNYDVYYLSGYVKPFQVHGDGKPILVYVKEANLRGICVYMLRDICDEKRLKGIPKQQFYDMVTPYGYGGFIWEGDVSIDKLKKIQKRLVDFYRANGIICEFVRWHPMLQNAEIMRNVIEVIDLGKTVHMDTSSAEIISSNMLSKDRSTVRNAIKKGVIVRHSADPTFFIPFREIYNGTMKKDNADSYYFFSEDFYKAIFCYLLGNYEIFYAEMCGEIIAMSIIIFANHKMHYHLSGSLAEFRNANATSLILYEAALWGVEKGYTTFHLGGGVGSGEDHLLKFKRSFNRNSNNQFSVSKVIYNKEIYETLLQNREDNDVNFNIGTKFFI